MSRRRIIGIDPGLAGGLGILEQDAPGALWTAAPLVHTPVVWTTARGRRRREYDLPAMRDALNGPVGICEPAEVLVALELASTRPGQDAGGTLRTGIGFGIWLGLIVGTRLPYVVVPPVVWKRHHGLLRTDKRASRLRATERFPSLGVLRAADEGPAEALLLASYVVAREDGRTCQRATDTRHVTAARGLATALRPDGGAAR